MQKNVQRRVQHCRIVLEVIAQALGHGEHPLAYRQTRDYVFGKMSSDLDHVPETY